MKGKTERSGNGKKEMPTRVKDRRRVDRKHTVEKHTALDAENFAYLMALDLNLSVWMSSISPSHTHAHAHAHGLQHTHARAPVCAQ